MADFVADVEEFNDKFGLTYRGLPRRLPPELNTFRLELLMEELGEYTLAVKCCRLADEAGNETRATLELAKMLDALVDLTYVVIGTAHQHGFDFRGAWRRVHEANMKKVRAESPEQSKRGSAFDVVKPPGWVAPDHTDLVAHHIHKGLSDEG